jgi:hypothetical protein
VKTGFGIPLKTSVIGVIVVSMYSMMDVKEDAETVRKCVEDFGRCCPEPKWKLVVEMGMGEGGMVSTDMMMHPHVAKAIGMVHHSCKHAPPSVYAGENVATHSAAMNSAGPMRVVNCQHSPAIQPASFVVTAHPSPASKATIASSSTSAPVADSLQDEEQRVAALLGDHMPLAEHPAPGDSTSSTGPPSSLVPDFISLRLLLRRSLARRSPKENDVLDVVKQTFRGGYSKDKHRSDKELAFLLAKDWQYLKTTTEVEVRKPPPKSKHEHQCFVIDVPSLNI